MLAKYFGSPGFFYKEKEKIDLLFGKNKKTTADWNKIIGI